MSKAVFSGISRAPYELEQIKVKEFIKELFSDTGVDVERLITVFDNAEIKKRYIAAPIEWFGETHSFKDRNILHKKVSIAMVSEAIRNCLKNGNIDTNDIDHIIFINSTGISTPTIDSYIINEFKFKNNIKRTPVWGLGCAGGAVGLSRAFEYTKAFPEHNCLIAAIELCSLNFQKDDLSKSNIIASSLFSDGAAAVLVAGEKSKYYVNFGLEFQDSLSTLYYDSSDVMGWEIVDNGFKVIFSRDIPTIVKEKVNPNIKQLLGKNGLDVQDIKYFLAHPGGVKVINAFEESLMLTNGKLNISREILRENGNMSSVSVLFVLNKFLQEGLMVSESYGIISALGPGFSSELILFKAT